MSRVITFSRVFPAYHPKKGQPTYFVEQIYNCIFKDQGDWSEAPGDASAYVVDLNTDIKRIKSHTIRKGHRWKVGDKFSPRVWSGKPYQSPMITIADDIEIVKVWDIEVMEDTFYLQIPGKDHKILTPQGIADLANNDGLDMDDLLFWFQSNISGQVICWNESINY